MYTMVNMRSSTPPPDDRTIRARLRDAAIELVAEQGTMTARSVAQRAGLSAGSVINHFGSMQGLRRACDEHVAAEIRRQKQKAVAAGAGLDFLGALREAEMCSMLGYLAAVLHDDSPEVARLIDELTADAEVYMAQGVDSGLIKPSADPRSRAVVLMLWSLGALAMNRHLERLLGVDLTSPDADLSPYARPILELYAQGLLTAAAAEHAVAHESTAPPSAQKG